MELGLDTIRDKFAARHEAKWLTRAKGRRGAAVLIPLAQRDGELCILFEKRSPDIIQGGEICFPGGGIEDGETPQQAIVREVSEELLIPEGQVEILAPMHVITGPGGGEVISFLGALHQYSGTFSGEEVAEVFCVPLSWFENNPPAVYEGYMQTVLPDDFPYDKIPGGRAYPFRRQPRVYYFYDVPASVTGTRGQVIWGMTAQLLVAGLEEILKTR